MKHMNVTIKGVVCGIHLQEDKMHVMKEFIGFFNIYLFKILLYSIIYGLLVVVPGIFSIILLDPPL